MVNTLGLFTGVTLSLLTTIQSPSQTIIVSDSESTSTAQISDFSAEHQVLSTYGAEIQTIQLEDKNTVEKIEAEKKTQTKPPVKKKSPVLIAAHPLNKDLLFDLVNAHRTSLELPIFEKDDDLCQIAESRLPELHDEIFGETPMHEGMRTRTFDYWVTENLIHVATEERALDWWLNSPIHRKALESPNHTHSCIACTGNSCTMLFTSFIPK